MSTRTKAKLPRKRDLTRRYTIETCVYYRVWDELQQEYIDRIGNGKNTTTSPWTDDEEAAQGVADKMESTR